MSPLAITAVVVLVIWALVVVCLWRLGSVRRRQGRRRDDWRWPR